MNQYKCETCKHREDITDAFYNTIWCKKHDEAINPSTINLVGCASHSDFQSERDTVLERLHIWFENYCEGNEDPDLWVAFLHAERTLRRAGES